MQIFTIYGVDWRVDLVLLSKGNFTMAMNREQRRYLQRQGQLDSEGNVIPKRRERTMPDKNKKTSPKEYFSGVKSELRKVTWPTKSETINYTIVVTITLLIITALVAGLDFGFSKGVGALLDLGG